MRGSELQTLDQHWAEQVRDRDKKVWHASVWVLDS